MKNDSNQERAEDDGDEKKQRQNLKGGKVDLVDQDHFRCAVVGLPVQHPANNQPGKGEKFEEYGQAHDGPVADIGDDFNHILRPQGLSEAVLIKVIS